MRQIDNSVKANALQEVNFIALQLRSDLVEILIFRNDTLSAIGATA